MAKNPFDDLVKRTAEELAKKPKAPQYPTRESRGFKPQYVTPEDANPKASCKTCFDQGTIIADAPGTPLHGQWLPCPEHCRASLDTWERYLAVKIKAAKVPDNYARLSLDTWLNLSKDEKANKHMAYNAAVAFLNARKDGFKVSKRLVHEMTGVTMQGGEQVKTGIMFFGEVGVGKTGLLTSIVIELLAAFVPAVYIRVQDLLTEVQKRYGRDSEEAPTDVKEIFKTVKVLALDEFNIENVTHDRREIMEEIIRYRYAYGLPTICTANLGQPEFRAHWGDRIADPVRAMCHWIHVGGQNLREIDESMGNI